MSKTNYQKPTFFLRSILALSLVVVLFGCKGEEAANEETGEASVSTFYLIRHAEKDRTDPSNSNPELNQDGLGRAIGWAEVLDKVDLTAIYSTNFERTSMTAGPAAVKNSIEIQYYDPSDMDIAAFIAANEGGNVLVVGHSNTTPDFVNKLLGEEKYGQMEDDDNASLFIVRFINGVPTDIRLQIE